MPNFTRKSPDPSRHDIALALDAIQRFSGKPIQHTTAAEVRAEIAAKPVRAYVRRVDTESEADIQKMILRLCRIHPKVCWIARMNSGVMTAGPADNQRYIRMGFKGCSDLLGMLKGGRLLAIEVKSKNGRVSPDQQAFLDKVNSGSGLGIVARSVVDVDLALKYA